MQRVPGLAACYVVLAIIGTACAVIEPAIVTEPTPAPRIATLGTTLLPAITPTALPRTPSIQVAPTAAPTETPSAKTPIGPAVGAATATPTPNSNLRPRPPGLVWSGGILYVESVEGYIYALNASTAILSWQYETAGANESLLGVAEGLLFVGSNSGRLTALDGINGRVLWQFGPLKSYVLHLPFRMASFTWHQSMETCRPWPTTLVGFCGDTKRVPLSNPPHWYSGTPYT